MCYLNCQQHKQVLVTQHSLVQLPKTAIAVSDDIAILGDTRDANFQDAEIVRSEERHGLGPRERPSRVQEQRHFRGLGEICHCISDVIDQIYRKYCKKIN